MSCTASFPSNAPGAQAKGPWFNGDGTWDKTKKLAVLGQNYHPSATFSTTIEGATRVIKTNNLPQPSIGYTGNFPVSPTDPAYQIDRNPGSPAASERTYRVPANPVVASAPTCTGLGAIGIVNDGVVLFNALDAGGRDAGPNEVLDGCGGHPARTEYHHHDLDTCLKDTVDASGHSKLLGYALDGFGIFGKFGPGGVELTNDDLDECHGHTHDVEWDGKTVAMYHYHATAAFPYSVSCFKGTPMTASADPH
ncbi:MAG: YHYH protein [Dehalococcoidia bacterium]